MAARFRSLVGLGLTAAALAAFVPGVFEPARLAPSVKVANGPSLSGIVASPAPKVMLPAPGKPSTLQRARSVVPTGCERLVSPLARSVASATASRCIT